MRWLDRLERHFHWLTIPQFPLFIATANGLIYLMAQFEPRFVQQLTLDPMAVRAGSSTQTVRRGQPCTAPLTLASMQFSPRILTGFVEDRASQRTIGIFLGTFLYCLGAYPACSAGTRGSVYAVAVLGATALAVTCVAALVQFIHHIALSINVNFITERIALETERVIDDVMPEPRAPPIAFSSWALLSVNRIAAGRPSVTCSLKLTTNISSFGLLDCTKLRAAAATSASLGRMLVLWSTTNPTVTGISSLVKTRIFCAVPFS